MSKALHHFALTRRQFIAASTASVVGQASINGVVIAAPDPTPPPLIIPPQIRIDLSSVNESTLTLAWQPVDVGCHVDVQIAGIFEHLPETRVMQDVPSGLSITDLPSLSLYTVRLKTVCPPDESDWTTPVSFCTHIPKPQGIFAEAMPVGGAARVTWNVSFNRPVLNTDTVLVQVFRSQSGAVTQVFQSPGQGQLEDSIHDAGYSPDAGYFCRVVGNDLANSAVTLTSPVSDEFKVPWTTVFVAPPKREITSQPNVLLPIPARWNIM